MNLAYTFLITFYLANSTPINDSMNARTGSWLQKKPLFSFGLVADVQYCDCDAAGTRYYRSSPEKLIRACEVFRNEKTSFTINLGDLIDRDFDSYFPVLDIIDRQKTETYFVAGNHDFSVDGSKKGSIPALKNSKNGFYSFIRKGFRLVFLNGNEISTYASTDKTAIAYATSYLSKLKDETAVNAEDWNGGIGPDQIRWLGKQLDEAEAAGEKAIIFCHFPIAPENIHNLLNYKEILAVINRPGIVVAWFSGHNHAGNYTRIGDTHHITMKGMVETETTASFSVVSVYPDRIFIKGYGNEQDRTLNFN